MRKINRKIIRVINRIKYGKCETIDELRARGVKIGNNCSICTDKIDFGHGYLISIGNNVTISDAALIAHDGSTKKILGYSKVGSIIIGDNVFIGFGALILPNVKIGDNVVVGAGSVVIRDIPSDSVVAGNPARVVCTMEAFIEKNKRLFEDAKHFDTPWGKKSETEKAEMFELLKSGGIAFDD